MIVEHAMPANAAGRAWDLRPNRSISRRGLYGFFAVMAVTSLAVSGFSYTQGNAFAPAFALAELALLAACLRLVWRKLAAWERLELTEQALVVEAPDRRSRFHPYWVRLRRDERGLLRLGSHGREIAVGAFLPEDERERLAASVAGALAKLQRYTDQAWTRR